MLKFPERINLKDFTSLDLARAIENNAILLEEVMRSSLEFTLTFTIGAEVDTFTLVDENGDAVAPDNVGTPGVFTVPFGKYSYTAVGAGYFSKEDIPVLANSAKAISVDLVLEEYRVVFNVSEEGSTITVLDVNTDPVVAEADGSYTLVPGTYTYTVALTGFTSDTGTITVVDEGQTIEVLLEA